MYQGSHLPNFEALGVPNSKWQTWTHAHTHPRTATASSHSEGILRNLHKKTPERDNEVKFKKF